MEKGCRGSMNKDIETLYEFLCEDKFVAEASTQRQCFLAMFADVALRDCHTNATQKIREMMTSEKPGRFQNF